MRTQPLLTLLGAAAVLSAGALTLQALSREEADPRNDAGEAQASQAPGGVVDLLYAQPFVLEQSYVHRWRTEAPEVTEGWLVVLDVEAHRVEPRNSLEPVLYAGDQTVERINHGHASGRVVAVLPGPVDLDLEAIPFWFGAPELPERVTAASLAAERARAEAAGVEPFPTASVRAARDLGGPPVTLVDRMAVHQRAAHLILEWSPADEALARSKLIPILR